MKIKDILPILTQIAFALWWGGFTFYAAWVIPIGHDVLGDKTIVGMITQKVSVIINALSAAFLGVAFLQAYLEKHGKTLWILLIIIALGSLGLVFLHPVLDNFIKTKTHSLTDKTAFYNTHRIYLWVSTVMWLAGLSWLVLYFRQKY